MRIAAIKPFAVAGPVSDLLLVKVEADDGSFGWGEGSLPGKCGAVAQAVRELEPLLLGWDALNVERAWQRMYRHSYWRGGSILTSSISAVDMALWDLRGRALGAPVHLLLGGRVRDRVRLYANIGLSSDPGELRDRAAEALSLGYTAVKFYPLPAVGPLPEPGDVAPVARAGAAVRDAVGETRAFALDFHGRCSAAVAVAMERAVRDFAPLWIEEPVPAEATSALARCAEKFVVPLALGERLVTRWAFREVFEGRLADVVQPDAANAGGISETMRIAAMAELYGVAFAPHNPNGPVQAAASLHLAAAAQNFSILEHRHDCADAWASWFKGPAVTPVDGTVAVPDAPGLGVEVDEAALARLAARPPAPKLHESFRADGSVADW